MEVVAQPVVQSTMSVIVEQRREVRDRGARGELHVSALDGLGVGEGVSVLSWGRDGASTVPAEVVQACGCLPLALRIAGGRLRGRSSWTVGHLSRRLRERMPWLDEFATGDRSLAAAFALALSFANGYTLLIALALGVGLA